MYYTSLQLGHNGVFGVAVLVNLAADLGCRHVQGNAYPAVELSVALTAKQVFVIYTAHLDIIAHNFKNVL